MSKFYVVEFRDEYLDRLYENLQDVTAKWVTEYPIDPYAYFRDFVDALIGNPINPNSRIYGFTNNSRVIESFKKARNLKYFKIKKYNELPSEIRNMNTIMKYDMGFFPYGRVHIISSQNEYDAFLGVLEYIIEEIQYCIPHKFPSYILNDKLLLSLDTVGFTAGSIDERYGAGSPDLMSFDMTADFVNSNISYGISPFGLSDNSVQVNVFNLFIDLAGFTLRSDFKCQKK